MFKYGNDYILRHQILLSITGIICGALGLFFLFSRLLFYSSWGLWNTINGIAAVLFFLVSAVCLCGNLYLLFAAVSNRLENSHRVRVIAVCCVYFAAALWGGFALNSINDKETGYIFEATVIEKSVAKENGAYMITMKPLHEEYTVKLYCNITEYNLTEIGRKYTQIEYTIWDDSDKNKGILKKMVLFPK